jgi:hypothetical protein
VGRKLMHRVAQLALLLWCRIDIQLYFDSVYWKDIRCCNDSIRGFLWMTEFGIIVWREIDGRTMDNCVANSSSRIRFDDLGNALIYR